ncbi:hypothetical protein Moror_1821 [Moniliophthora roreri MCA 2997]|uniref:P-loop containing nucleoside triphosphate hydrolase protein n=2 Tax=Moniliophthora roreri TaxID=221103 RepID=V2X5K3_MONRO|nr:hypothetical protein Moror_1821 [Moniliophthora roreri MCA 2997]
MPKLSQEGRRMLDMVNHLHDTGVQVDIDLPQIAVIGNQSAGKSSLIEAISGITLPRASGTCTRCPTEIRLKHSNEPWECRVSLRFISDSSGQKLGQALVEPFGEVIRDKREVEDRIRRAQRAILNPNIDHLRFLTEDDINNTKTDTFSANCIALEIAGPDVADLSFVDLPGLIQVADDNNTDIKDVELMVKSYIEKPSCIILLTVSCETDHMNQGALRLARESDHNGDRTVGVLTKPDRIERGDEQNWLGFIQGRTEPLRNHWFCVKQPGTSDLQNGITWSQARDNENKFFATTSPWRDLELTYQKYLRTNNLVERLSVILSDLISKRLPEIQTELENAIQRVRALLRELPKEPSKDPQTEISSMIHAFAAAVGRHVEGTPNELGLLQVIRPFQENFRKDIRNTAPKFLPFDKDTPYTVGNLGPVDPDPAFIKHEEEAESQDIVNQPVFNVIPIDEVMKRARNARTRELPGNHPYVVEESFISEITCQWLIPSKTLCEKVFHSTKQDVNSLISEYFGTFGQGHLERQVKLVVQDHLRKRREDADNHISWLVNLEGRPYTSNTHYLCDYRDKFLGHYKGQRQQAKTPWLMHQCLVNGAGPEMQKVISALAAIGVEAKPEDIQRLLPPDEMEPALKIMAEVRAYFQGEIPHPNIRSSPIADFDSFAVAYKRFTDMIPLAIDYELVRGLERNLLQTLFTGLKIHGADGHRICGDFAQESPQIAGRREELSQKLERLLSAVEQLSAL